MKNQILTVIATALLIPSITFGFFTEARQGEYKGVVQLSKNIQSRMMSLDTDFTLERYLNNDRELSALLGKYQLIQGKSEFVNGDPNGVNFVLHYIAFSQFTKEIISLCEDSSEEPKEDALVFNDSFLKTFKLHCEWENDSATETNALGTLWYHIMGFEAPDEEKEAWIEFVQKTLKDQDKNTALTGLLNSIFLNPFFLLIQ